MPGGYFNDGLGYLRNVAQSWRSASRNKTVLRGRVRCSKAAIDKRLRMLNRRKIVTIIQFKHGFLINKTRIKNRN